MKLKAGILGVGAAGMEFVKALENHPDFEVVEIFGNTTVGKTLEDVARLSKGELQQVRKIRIKPIAEINQDLDIICSALPSDTAKRIEAECANHTPVVSTTSAYRYESDVPVIITEINSGHYRLLELQQQRGWKGWILPGPNCTTVGLVMSLYTIYKEFGVKRVVMSSYQSVSGAGKEKLYLWEKQRTTELPFPLDNITQDLIIEGNVIPLIEGEEAKVKRESLKVLGEYKSGGITTPNFDVQCTCVRVPVAVGHLETVFVETENQVSIEQVLSAYSRFNEASSKNYGTLYSSPKNTITFVDVPQPRLHANLDGGMTAIIGRLEAEDNRIRYVVLSNNLQRGAAKGVIHVAEYLHSIGFLAKKS